jgi:2-polyprenyl-3-methyl-5-hydroxy-6-metoxy-1,4-benzoquinol methylase
MVSAVERIFLNVMIRIGVFPNIFFVPKPFKIYEFKEIEKDINFLKTDLVLDLGCGLGVQTLCLGKKCGKVIGIDIDCDAIRSAEHLSRKTQRKITSEFKCCSLEEANFPRDHFDKVFSICVIEHIDDYEGVIDEIYGVIKPGGVFAFSADALTVIDSPELLDKHRRDAHVTKYFSPNELHQLLTRKGFKNIAVYPIFKSNFAKHLFMDAIKDGFKIKRTFIIDYLRLSISERYTRNRDGIFIIAKCTK